MISRSCQWIDKRKQRRTILLIGARPARFVFGMEETGDLRNQNHHNYSLHDFLQINQYCELAHREIAFGGRNPQIGAPGVEDHREILRRGTDPNLPEVLSVHVVLEGDNVAVVRLRRSVRAVLKTGTVAEEGAILTGGQDTELLRVRQPRSEPAVPVQWPLLQPNPDEAVGGTRKTDNE